jgi:hypothetical protein
LCSTVRCISHTVELAAKDVIKIYAKDIEVIRKVVKKLRTIEYTKDFSDNNVPEPPLDNTTRWNSTFLMIQHLESHSEFLKSIRFASLQLGAYEWDLISEVSKAFKPIFQLSKSSQNSQLTYGKLELVGKIHKRSRLKVLKSMKF